MIKNTELKKLIIIQIIIFLFSIILCIVFYNKINKDYSETLINNDANLIGNFLIINPDLEQKLLSVVNSTQNYELGQKFLEENNLLDYREKNYSVNFITIFLSVLTVFSILIVINYYFIRKLYKKIKEIDYDVDKILQGNYEINILDYNEGSLSSLKNNIYKMTVKLRESNELISKEKNNLEELLEDISHQIKTPLTSMYMINDILQKETNSKVRQEFLDKNEKQINRIEWLVTSLLKMSRLDNGSVKLKKEMTNVDTMLTKAITPILPLIESKNIKVKHEKQNLKIKIDPDWTSEALLNIIKNACEHTKDSVTITTSSNPLYTAIEVKDNGEGIDKKDLSHLFERFYRGNHNKESIGIGLSMSKKIIELQNGTIEVKSLVGKGSTFIVKFFKN